MPGEEPMAPSMPTDGQVETTPVEGQGDDTQPVETGQATVTDDTSSTEESFTSLDPNSIPEELKPFYNSMLKDYRGKTTEVSGLRSKAEAFDGLMQNEQFTRFMDAVSKIGTGNDPTQTPVSGEETLLQILENPEKLNEIIRNEAQKMFDPLAQDVYLDKANQVVNGLRQKYPDFEQYEPQIAEMVDSDGIDPEKAYKILTYDKVKQQGINEGAKVVAKRNSAAQPTTSTATVVPDGHFGSVFDAFQAAKKQAGLS